ncbi:hypothetical protein VaNZ11_000983 [Volvox africanus]|uniref:Uncharacterized protein n=1 Tax=Volvox africanus TaxID=51714 RepID=A0ABQ5RNL7_9CHLO|nr:hypothetical protein VaNZ11_000983 [Volvox africanus]
MSSFLIMLDISLRYPRILDCDHVQLLEKSAVPTPSSREEAECAARLFVEEQQDEWPAEYWEMVQIAADIHLAAEARLTPVFINIHLYYWFSHFSPKLPDRLLQVSESLCKMQGHQIKLLYLCCVGQQRPDWKDDHLRSRIL